MCGCAGLEGFGRAGLGCPCSAAALLPWVSAGQQCRAAVSPGDVAPADGSELFSVTVEPVKCQIFTLLSIVAAMMFFSLDCCPPFQSQGDNSGGTGMGGGDVCAVLLCRRGIFPSL